MSCRLLFLQFGVDLGTLEPCLGPAVEAPSYTAAFSCRTVVGRRGVNGIDSFQLSTVRF